MIYQKTIGAKVTVETYQQVQSLARERACNPSDVVRDAVCYYMKHPSTAYPRKNTRLPLTKEGQLKWTHSSTGKTLKNTQETKRTPSLLESMQARHIQSMQEAKSAGEAIGGLVLLASVLLKCR